MGRNKEREDDTDTSLVCLIYHINCAKGHDCKISKLQLHSFR